MDRDSQIKAIEKTFEDVKKPITHHPSKPNVTPVSITEVFPDFKVNVSSSSFLKSCDHDIIRLVRETLLQWPLKYLKMPPKGSC